MLIVQILVTIWLALIAFDGIHNFVSAEYKSGADETAGCIGIALKLAAVFSLLYFVWH